MKNEKTTTETAIETVTQPETQITVVSDARDFDVPETATLMRPENREQLEMLAELDALNQQIANLDLTATAPNKLADTGIVFDILDCYPAEIKDGDELKTVACFKIVEQGTGVEHLVMQSLNSIRELYVRRFGSAKALGAPQSLLTLRGYEFVTSGNPKHEHAGNRAIILKQAQKR